MRKVETSIEIQAGPDAVIAAFTEPEPLRGWWGVERSLVEKRPGGLYVLAWQISGQGFGYISSGTVHAYEPEGLLLLENLVYLNPDKPILGPMTLTIRATRLEDGTGTRLDLCQDGYQDGPDWDWYYEAVRDAWPKAVQTLKNYLETQMQPNSPDKR